MDDPTAVAALFARVKKRNDAGRAPGPSVDDLSAGHAHFSHALCPVVCRPGIREPQQLTQAESPNPVRISPSEDDNIPDAAAREALNTRAIRDILNSLTRNKAPGDDGFTIETLLPNIDSMAAALSSTYQFYLDIGSVPSAWSHGILMPVYKGKGRRADWSSQQPIVLLNLFRKIFETAFAKMITPLADISPFQGGFQKGRGTLEMVRVIHHILDHRRRKQQQSWIALLDIDLQDTKEAAAFLRSGKKNLWNGSK